MTVLAISGNPNKGKCMPKLFVMTNLFQGSFYELKGNSTSIGRLSDNDIQIKDSSVSRHHLKIFIKSDSYYVEDLNSTNGSAIDGKRLNPGILSEVKKGSPFSIGNILLSLDEPCLVGVRDNAGKIPGGLSNTGVFNKDRRKTETTRNLELIYNVSNVLMQSLRIEELFDKILDYLFDFLKRIDRCTILLIDDQTGEIKQIIGRSKYDDKKSIANYSRQVANKVIARGEAVCIMDTGLQPLLNPSDSMSLIRCVMCVPLISKSKIRGAIYVDSITRPYGFRKDDLSLLSTLSSPAAIAIENALLYSNLEKIIERRTKSLRETEKRLKESDARFKAMFDNMSSGVMVYQVVDEGQDYLILDLNRAAGKIEKTDKQKALNKRLLKLCPEMKNSDLINSFNRVCQSGKAERCDLINKDDNKIKAWKEYYIYRLSSGELVSICDDITNKQRAEEEQRQLQKQLFVAQKMESIGDFAGGTAHNFRNILQVVSGNIEYLEMIYNDKPEVKEVAKNINKSVEKGVDLINNLLQFSKKGTDLELIDSDLYDVIINSYALIEKVFNKNIKIILDLSRDLNIKGNNSLLSQVFMNIFTNARDAMPEGGELLISANKMDNEVVVTISDTGLGIDKENLNKIFEPFVTLKEVGKGTGLGLSTSLGIIEQHNGTLSVSSEPNEGTTFKIVFPISNSKVIREERTERRICYGQGQRVLIVDDDSFALEALTNLINRLGYQGIAVDKALDTIGSFKKWRPDIVLMDRNMPSMDGISCIRKIIQIDPAAKIIIVSGYEASGSDGINGEIRSLIRGYLTKPCGIEILSSMLAQVLKN